MDYHRQVEVDVRIVYLFLLIILFREGLIYPLL